MKEHTSKYITEELKAREWDITEYSSKAGISEDDVRDMLKMSPNINNYFNEGLGALARLLANLENNLDGE